jgi:hypothetical protein
MKKLSVAGRIGRRYASSKPRVLEKPSRFNPPSHPQRIVKHRQYGPALSAQEQEAQKTRKYPHMMPPDGSFMHWFLTSRSIHIWITMVSLVLQTEYPADRSGHSVESSHFHNHQQLQVDISICLHAPSLSRHLLSPYQFYLDVHGSSQATHSTQDCGNCRTTETKGRGRREESRISKGSRLRE